jgi:hypothetical protein
MEERTLGRSRLMIRATVLASGLLALLVVGAATAPDSRAYRGAGSCGSEVCIFCKDSTLDPRGNPNYFDRCAYGHFRQADSVMNEHLDRSVRLCAGMKQYSDGSGHNKHPVGFDCSTYPQTAYSKQALGTCTSGYMTIANGAQVTHYHFKGVGTYARQC